MLSTASHVCQLLPLKLTLLTWKSPDLHQTLPTLSFHHDLCLVTVEVHLTLKAPITTSADDIHKYFFIVFQRK